jgi:hypothetical protein
MKSLALALMSNYYYNQLVKKIMMLFVEKSMKMPLPNLSGNSNLKMLNSFKQIENILKLVNFTSE